MAGGINKVTLVGNLGQDPEVRYLEGGTAVANLRIATTESYRDRTTNDRVSHTEWHNVVLWRGLAETAEKYLRKGSQVYIEGKLRTRTWDDQAGNKHYATEIVGDQMLMLGGRSESSPAQPATATPAPAAAPVQSAPKPANSPAPPTEHPEDDLPF